MYISQPDVTFVTLSRDGRRCKAQQSALASYLLIVRCGRILAVERPLC